MLLLAFVMLSSARQAAAQDASVTLLRVPEGGIQPQVVMDASGVVHMVYFKGEAAAGDLFYVRHAPGEDGFSEPMRVNTRSGSATAIGTIRGAQVAAGEAGRVHVVWNGSSEARTSEGREPLLYTRLNDAGTGFESERNVITSAYGLDGGSAVAADGRGNVYVVWHAGPHGAPESERAIYLARSRDGGRTFEAERRINAAPTGVCGCCGLRAYVDRGGEIYVLYRGAREHVHRDMHLLVSRAGGNGFEHSRIHPWEVAACPMSSAAFTEDASGVVAAWQTGEQVFFARLDASTAGPVRPFPASGAGSGRKHPVLATRADGSLLFAWTEGTGWGKGGVLAWQVYDENGAPTAEHGRVEGVPVWSFPAAYADADGRFVLLY